MQRFSGTLLPQSNSTEEIRKAILDLFNKINDSHSELQALIDEINSRPLMITEEGGLARQFINGTGLLSVKGETVHIKSGSNLTVERTQINVPDCIGVWLEDNVSPGAFGWVVVSGVGYVKFINAVTAGWLARTFVTADVGAVVGQAIGEPLPTSPFATDKHFCEIGHIAETTTSAGLARVNLHFN